MPKLINLSEGLKKQYVAFLDVLGFSELVYNSEIKILEDYFTLISYLAEQHRIKSTRIKILLVSDSIILITEDTIDDFINLATCIQDIQARLLANKIILRGGISYGEVYFENDVLVGKGFIRAYNLEKLADVPRVIIDPIIISKIGGTIKDFINTLNYNAPLGEIPNANQRKEYNVITQFYPIRAETESDAIELDYLSKFLFDMVSSSEREIRVEKFLNYLKVNLYNKQDHYKKYKWLKKQILLSLTSTPGTIQHFYQDVEKRDFLLKLKANLNKL